MEHNVRLVRMREGIVNLTEKQTLAKIEEFKALYDEFKVKNSKLFELVLIFDGYSSHVNYIDDDKYKSEVKQIKEIAHDVLTTRSTIRRAYVIDNRYKQDFLTIYNNLNNILDEMASMRMAIVRYIQVIETRRSEIANSSL